MTSRKARRLHIEIEPPVAVEIEGHTVTFDGLHLLRPHVMVEYDVDPPIEADRPFGPHLLVLEVSDDSADDLYPTAWPDWRWRDRGPGRTTTRLERRPPPDATRLHIVVRPAEPYGSQPQRPERSTLPAVVEFDVPLPRDHHLPSPRLDSEGR